MDICLCNAYPFWAQFSYTIIFTIVGSPNLICSYPLALFWYTSWFLLYYSLVEDFVLQGMDTTISLSIWLLVSGRWVALSNNYLLLSYELLIQTPNLYTNEWLNYFINTEKSLKLSSKSFISWSIYSRAWSHKTGNNYNGTTSSDLIVLMLTRALAMANTSLTLEGGGGRGVIKGWAL